MKRTILYAAAALLLGGCFKSVGYDTDVILKVGCRRSRPPS